MRDGASVVKSLLTSTHTECEHPSDENNQMPVGSTSIRIDQDAPHLFRQRWNNECVC